MLLQNVSESKLEKEYTIYSGTEKNNLDIDKQLNYIKLKWIQMLLNLTNDLWKDL